MGNLVQQFMKLLRARAIWGAFLTILLGGVAVHPAIAQIPPPNNQCQNAQPIDVNVLVPGTTIGATTDGAASCAVSGFDVYYRFIPLESSEYVITLCETALDWNTVLSVHQGCPAQPSNQIACNDDSCNRLSVVGRVQMNIGTSYVIRVAGGGGAVTQENFKIKIKKGDPGACCTGSAGNLCTDVSSCLGNCPATCHLGWKCDPENPCKKGACCGQSSGACDFRTEPVCTSLLGYFVGEGTTCGISQCQAGACCIPASGTCVPGNETGCQSVGGIFQAYGSVCGTTACSVGACCDGTTCSVATPNTCAGASKRFAGFGTSCNPQGNQTMPCCFADFNQSGVVSVQDIFDFLFAYFSGFPNVDINQSGVVSVQDIFDFLAAYFSGC